MKTEQHCSIKRTAFFRFYSELNDFLPEKQRKITFLYKFLGKPSVKDTIEAIGVPHTEIDLILVDGKSVCFNYRICGGEHISVYPVFESFDITPLVHLRPGPLRKTIFIADANLGVLARKIRLLGFDVLFRNDFTEKDIIKLSLQEKRIILTRHKKILKHSAVTHGYWIRSNDPKRQLYEVVNHLQLENNLKPFTRCSICNERLYPVDKRLLKGRLPKNILLVFNDFMECEKCRKIYWRGSHYDRICEWIEELKIRKPWHT